MKTIFLFVVLLSALTVQAATFGASTVDLLASTQRQHSSDNSVELAIPWAVGEKAEYNLYYKRYLANYLGSTKVSEEVPELGAVWLDYSLGGRGFYHTERRLIRRTDGTVLRQLINGREVNLTTEAAAPAPLIWNLLEEGNGGTIKTWLGTFTDTTFARFEVYQGSQILFTSVKAFFSKERLPVGNLLRIDYESAAGPIYLEVYKNSN